MGGVTPAPEPIVRARSIVKRFPGVVALDDVDLDLFPGEVHALVGENGAGKSSLIKVLSGYYVPDGGSLEIGGRRVGYSVTSSRSHGIATIHQEHHLVPELSVAENIVMPEWTPGRGMVRRSEMQRRAGRALEPLLPGLDLSRPARELSPGEGQLVEIARGLAQDARVLILDEPTTALSLSERDKLFATVKHLQAEGMAILYVSHNLEDVLYLADRVTVMRNGKTVETGAAADYTPQRMVKAMVGREVSTASRANESLGETVLEVANITRGRRVRDVSFDVRAGEVVALVGLEGSGRTEVARCIFGIDRMSHGTVTVDGARVAYKDASSGVAAGIGLVPEERKTQGIFPILSVRENISISLLDLVTRLGLVRVRRERTLASDAVRRLDIRTASTETAIGTLSGGNQQKAILARWIERGCRVLLLDEPTKGIDVAAKAEIYRLIGELSREGTAIVLISSDLDECLPVANTFVVMRDGAVAARLDREQASKERIVSIATGEHERSTS